MRLSALSLCSGIGALDLALSPWCRAVGYVEREAFCQEVLLARMEDKSLDRAPVFQDLESFPAGSFRGAVDVVSAGLPCQPYSIAGARKGNDDDRALWPEFVRIVRECEPWAVFIENVPGFLGYAEPVWRELRALGFKWTPPLLSTAAQNGAPHDRLRVFLFAANTYRQGLQGERWKEGWRGISSEGGPWPTNHYGPGLHDERCGWLFDRERQTLRYDPDGCGPGCSVRGSLWEGESPPVRVDDGPPEWVDRTRSIGNSVCVPQAREAFRILAGLR